MKLVLTFAFAFMVSFLTFAQEVIPVGASAVNTLEKVNSEIPESLPATVLAILVFVISEVALRVFPTSKPKSWLLAVGKIFGLIGVIFTKISTLMDSVSQNLKPDPAQKSVESPTDQKV